MALSTSYTGKYTSERHQAARESGKLTAGELAKKINQLFPREKVKAAELRPFATEWHHSGFYKSNHGSTMGKTWFFSKEELEEIFNHFSEKYFPKILEARKKEEEVALEIPIEIFYFQARFERIAGRYGKLFWQPVAEIGSAMVKPFELSIFLNSKKTEITKNDYELLKQFNGKFLESYESFENFKNRML